MLKFSKLALRACPRFMRLVPARLAALSSTHVTCAVPQSARQFATEAPAASAVRPALTHLSEDEEMLRDAVRKFATDVVAPKVKEMDEKQHLDEGVLKGLFENGIMGIEIPTEYGGGGMTFTQACLAIEELARVDPGVAVCVDVHNTLCITAFRKFGNKEQQAQYFPKMSKDTVAAFCLSEPSSGSDAFALKSTAKLSSDKTKYVLNGSKIFITNALEAGIFIVFANANPAQGHKGITAFIVEKGNPGLKVGKKEDKLGIRASSTCELILEDCEVPASAVLGQVGKGYKIAIELLNEGRIGIAAQLVGLAQGAFDNALPYMHQRKQFGKIIASFQGMQFQYAHARVEIEAARLLMYNACRLRDSGKPFVTEAAFAKYYAAQVCQHVSAKAVEWLGGVGFTKDMISEKFYRDCLVGAIYEGTSNIQLQTIAKAISQQYQ